MVEGAPMLWYMGNPSIPGLLSSPKKLTLPILQVCNPIKLHNTCTLRPITILVYMRLDVNVKYFTWRNQFRRGSHPKHINVHKMPLFVYPRPPPKSFTRIGFVIGFDPPLHGNRVGV